ncbi:MAG: 4-hydroxy-tetrahydrodipicolinate reductase [Candidatus Marinimicrobia bacterium]|nr:4-hydroxy-tetrahydrodipicolinate reductase [Candidatus Neomarinimicrobiota bacterium]MCF7830038.1 4-hydroxy-tetrahydrodipicolinate reductase [Candidatus Neomarinimicrobiota bacterium]MCF7881922.1 4-hydroxy-tetrahydrodipicolinate reductase [Candidatus Neomarinimicrobiota bacterium]
MKIAVIGTGNTGQHVAGQAESRGHEVVETFDIDHPLTEENAPENVTFIDFSVGEMVPEYVDIAGKTGNNIVIGTTGWYDQLESVEKSVEESGIGCLYAPNFALGVNLFFRGTEFISKLFGSQNYDITIHEEHHTKKSDAPSGTALELGKIALKQFDSKSELLVGNPDGRIKPEQLQISSSRVGDVYGNHRIVIEGEHDRIEFSHSIKSRKTLAEGAVIAAEWLEGKQGLYTIHDLIDDILQEGQA